MTQTAAPDSDQLPGDPARPEEAPPPVEDGPLARMEPAALWARVRNLALEPTQEWIRIARERADMRQILLRWVAPLSVFFFLAPTLGVLAFPPTANGAEIRPNLIGALATILVGAAMMTGGVWALARIVDRLAPRFGGRSDPAQALKLVAYAGVALWLSQIFGLVPALVLLSVVGLYSAYILYAGLGPMMRTPPEHRVAFTAVILAAAVLLWVAAALVFVALQFVAPRPPPAVTEIAPPVAAKIDPAAPIDPDKFSRMLPEALPGGWVRAGISRNAGGALGFTGPTTEALYEQDGRAFTLRLVDTGIGGARETIGRAQALVPAGEGPSGLARYRADAGRFHLTRLDRKTGLAQRLIVVDERVVIAAEGAGVTIEELEGALAMIDLERARQLARGL